jgi:leucyl-tRNA synthetase
MQKTTKTERSDIESKWQAIWQDKGAFQARINHEKPKCYVLEMFPYPSGNLHVGHVRNYVIGDVIARYKRLCGFEVLHPIGWDAFGLPAENAAIEKGISPHEWTKNNINAMRAELLSLGLSYDWSREIATCDSTYYVHEQKLFIKMLEAGIAYRKESLVNWDPIDNTVLANEQVVNGRGWRSGALVEQKMLNQWFFKITDYAESLLNDLSGWPSNVKLMQKNWIGKAEGANIIFSIVGVKESVTVFSTRPETLFGCTFIAISPHHPLIEQSGLLKNPKVKSFVELCEKLAALQVKEEQEKLGLHTGLYAEHPLNKEIQIPIFIANFVLADYASGAIFGCPAHDARDWEFAQKYSLPVIQVIKSDTDNESFPYLDDGIMVNSGFLNDLSIDEARNLVIKQLIALGKGSISVQYKLRDWGISRQRYWGCPIPVIYCPSCGVLGVSEDQLPVVLPQDVSITGKGNPLELHAQWKKTICHRCGSAAERETDTFDTFFESSWYFLRFCSPQSSNLVDKKDCDYWMPVDHYIGGIEHAILHLMYARFLTKVILQLGYCQVSEPFLGLLNQGMVLHHTFRDKEGSYVHPSQVQELNGRLFNKDTNAEIFKSDKLEKMSKSKKNVVSLNNMVKEYGADTVRLFVMSDSPAERDLEWNIDGIEGCSKFVDRLFATAEYLLSEQEHWSSDKKSFDNKSHLVILTHKTVALVSDAIVNSRFNKAIALLRELSNSINDNISKKQDSHCALFAFKALIKMLNPFMPHITEEIWHKFGQKDMLAISSWPDFDAEIVKESFFTIAVQINGKLRATMQVSADLSEAEVKLKALNHEKISLYIKDSVLKKVVYVSGKVVNLIV